LAFSNNYITILQELLAPIHSSSIAGEKKEAC